VIASIGAWRLEKCRKRVEKPTMAIDPFVGV
jgi:hypothetical protein